MAGGVLNIISEGNNNVILSGNKLQQRCNLDLEVFDFC